MWHVLEKKRDAYREIDHVKDVGIDGDNIKMIFE